MTRDEYQDPTQHATAAERASHAFWALIRAETLPSLATVLADGSGRWWHAFCGRCGWRGQAAKDKKLIQARAEQHNSAVHGGGS